MLGRLRPPALAGVDHEQGAVDPAHPGEHVVDEPLVAGDVDEADLAAGRQGGPGEAEVDRQAPRLLLGQPVRVGPGQGLDQRRLAVVDMAGGADDVRHQVRRAPGDPRAAGGPGPRPAPAPPPRPGRGGRCAGRARPGSARPWPPPGARRHAAGPAPRPPRRGPGRPRRARSPCPPRGGCRRRPRWSRCAGRRPARPRRPGRRPAAGARPRSAAGTARRAARRGGRPGGRPGSPPGRPGSACRPGPPWPAGAGPAARPARRGPPPGRPAGRRGACRRRTAPGRRRRSGCRRPTARPRARRPAAPTRRRGAAAGRARGSARPARRGPGGWRTPRPGSWTGARPAPAPWPGRTRRRSRAGGCGWWCRPRAAPPRPPP